MLHLGDMVLDGDAPASTAARPQSVVRAVEHGRRPRGRSGRGFALGVSLGLHALALGAASVFLAGAVDRPAPEPEVGGTVRLDLRRAPPVRERAPAQLEVRRAIPEPLAEAEVALMPQQPLDRDAWSDAPSGPMDESPALATRGGDGSPEMASADRVARVPRRARPATAAGLGAAGFAGDAAGSGDGTGGAGIGSTGGGSGGSGGVAAIAAPQDLPAVALETPRPAYPTESRRRREQGIVACRIVVRADGTVDAVEVRRSSGSARLDAAAVAALSHWRFTPATRGGRPVASAVEQDVRFFLRG